MGTHLNRNAGLRIKALSADEFRDFAKRHGTSPEIGPIKTYLEALDQGEEASHAQFLGLFGCETLCAASCCTLAKSSADRPFGGKLDSVIVHQGMRRRGLASLLVLQSFLDLLPKAGSAVSVLYAHAVHPATVRMLRRLSFSKPPPIGAPLSALRINADNQDDIVTRFTSELNHHTSKLKLQCAFCSTDDRRKRPWCVPKS